MMVEHDRETPMIEADRADYSRAKLDHALIVSITTSGCESGV